MTLDERLLFIRAGYSAQDIANFEKADEFAKTEPKQEHAQGPKREPAQGPKHEPAQEPKQEPAQEPKQEPAQEPKQEPAQEPEKAPANDSEPAWAKALVESIKTLTAATQAANRRFDDMGEPEQVVDKALEALKEIYGGKNK